MTAKFHSSSSSSVPRRVKSTSRGSSSSPVLFPLEFSIRLQIPALASKLPVASTLSPMPFLPWPLGPLPGFQATLRTLRLCPPEIVLSKLKEVREYMRTERSEQAVATIGRFGCGEESQTRVLDGGFSVATGLIVGGMASDFPLREMYTQGKRDDSVEDDRKRVTLLSSIRLYGVDKLTVSFQITYRIFYWK